MSPLNPTELLVPQLGEGLTEVLIRQLLKKPGESIKRDEPIYVMETDKALVDAESPADGILQEWLVAPDDVVAVGGPVARLLVAGDQQFSFCPLWGRSPDLPVRGVSDSTPGQRPGNRQTGGPPHNPLAKRELLAGEGTALTPESSQGNSPESAGERTGLDHAPERVPAAVQSILIAHRPREAALDDKRADQDYVESLLSPSQRALVFRLNRSSRIAVPGNIGRPIDWQRITDVARAFSQSHAGVPFPALHAFAHCVAQAARAHPKFRSTLVGNATVREYRHLTLGVAVARPGDELVTAVIPEADRLDLPAFVTTLNRQMRRAWTRGDQAAQSTQLLLFSLEAEGITDGIPTLVAPASATLFVGAACHHLGQPTAKLSLTFDHRLINGMAAARFLNSIDQEIDQLKAAWNRD